MERARFLRILREALEAITEPRFFATERGFQGELLAGLRARLHEAYFPGDPVVEQEYQKRMREHDIRIRPDLIVHIPFERDLTRVRRAGNFVAVEIKRDINDVPAAFENLAVIERALDYALTVLVMVNSPDTRRRAVPGGYRAKDSVLRSPTGRTASPWYECRNAVSRQSNSAKRIVTRSEAVGVS